MQELSIHWEIDQSVGTSNAGDKIDSAWQNVSPSHDNDLAAALALQNSSTANDRLVLRSVSDCVEPVSTKSSETDNAAHSSSNTNAVSYILRPINSDLRVSTKTDKRTGMTKLSTLALVENVQLQLNNQQMCDLVRISDLFAVWDLRNRYAVLRPTGWRSDEHVVVPPRYCSELGLSSSGVLVVCRCTVSILHGTNLLGIPCNHVMLPVAFE